MTYSENQSRILFLDNLRYLMVLLVVVLHAAIPYSNFVPWWAVKEPNEHALFFDVVLLILDVFLMPVLCFIAGYFAISSFQSKGARLFLKRKFKRLGLPLLVGIPLISPPFSYIYHVTRNGFTIHESFSSHWMNYMKTAGDFPLGTMTSIDQFSHSHLWFMSLLLFFFIVFGFFAQGKIQKNHDTVLEPSGASSPITILWILAGVGVFSAAFSFIGSMLFASPSNPEPWVTIVNLLQFQPDPVGSYILYFSLGIYAYYRNWFIHTNIPGHLGIWCFACLVLSLCLLVSLRQVIQHLSPAIFIVYLLARSFLCVSALATFSVWALRYWNRPSRIHASLGKNSYHIYITHFLVVILLQLLMAGWSGVSVFLKFGMITVASILASYGISNYALRPLPRLSLAGFYTILIITFIKIHPC